jgi:hypothetical protein
MACNFCNIFGCNNGLRSNQQNIGGQRSCPGALPFPFEDERLARVNDTEGPGFGPNGPSFGPGGPDFGPGGPDFGPSDPGFGPGGPGFGPIGPDFGPNGPGFGPGGPGFGPNGPDFGPNGPGSGPIGPGSGPNGPGFIPCGPGNHVNGDQVFAVTTAGNETGTRNYLNLANNIIEIGDAIKHRPGSSTFRINEPGVYEANYVVTGINRNNQPASFYTLLSQNDITWIPGSYAASTTLNRFERDTLTVTTYFIVYPYKTVNVRLAAIATCPITYEYVALSIRKIRPLWPLVDTRS